MDKTIILTVTAIAILSFADSTNIAMAAEADDKTANTECVRKRDPARKQWRTVCPKQKDEQSQNNSDQSESQAEG